MPVCTVSEYGTHWALMWTHLFQVPTKGIRAPSSPCTQALRWAGIPVCSPFLLVPGQSRSSLDSLRSSSYKMASDGAKGSNYAHSFVSVTSSRCEPNTTPFCASTQALVPWSDTKCRQPFRCFIPIETGVTQHLQNGPHELKQRRERQKSKTTTLHVHHAFLYISLPSLHDYDVKMPNFTFCGEREHKTTTLQYFRIQLQKKLAIFDEFNEME